MELKEKYTDSICKEIVSFLNSCDGIIIIGIKNDGTVVGIEQVDEVQRKVSDIITNQIEPNPQNEVSMELGSIDEKTIVKIKVTKRIVERIFSSLQAKGLIKRVGSKRTEAWLIIDQ